MNAKTTSLIALIAVSAIAAPAYAEVPTVADFAACNMKAAEEAASDTASASPRTDRPAPRRAPDGIAGGNGSAPRGAVEMPSSPAGKAAAPGVKKDPTGKTLSSDKDPQIDGMAADRANDPVYVAAYRSCMRQRGF
jgi:hypothetical protein